MLQQTDGRRAKWALKTRRVFVSSSLEINPVSVERSDKRGGTTLAGKALPQLPLCCAGRSWRKHEFSHHAAKSLLNGGPHPEKLALREWYISAALLKIGVFSVVVFFPLKEKNNFVLNWLRKNETSLLDT